MQPAPQHRITLDSYPFRVRPFAHQYYVLDNSWPLSAFALHAEMGLGKTAITIANMGLLWANDRITKAIVVAPKTILGNWRREIAEHYPDGWRVETHVWRKMETKAEEGEWARFTRPNSPGDPLRILIINVDALANKKGRRYIDEFLRRVGGPTFGVIDESTKIKSMKALRTKGAIDLSRSLTYRRVLSGLPMPNSPLDIYAPFVFLSGDGGTRCRLLGYQSFLQFRARYAVLVERHMGPRRFQEVTGFQRLDELQAKIDAHAIRLTKAQCLDLPKQLYVRRDVELTPEQERAYKHLAEEVVLEEEEGRITAFNVLTKMLRFLQITCGHLTTEDGKVVEYKNNRLEALLDVVAEIQGKVIIWAHFRHSIDAIARALTKEYGEDSVAFIHGDVSGTARDEIVSSFQKKKSKLRFLVAHPGTAGFGLTLTESCTAIFYSRDFSLETRMQAEDRIHRIGQDRDCTYVDLVAPGTIDERVLRALRAKMKMSAKVLGEDVKRWI